MELEQASEARVTRATDVLEGSTATSRDEAVRVTALCRFARTIGISEEIAVVVYKQELQRLTSAAKLTRFVPLLAEKRTREVLRLRGRRGS